MVENVRLENWRECGFKIEVTIDYDEVFKWWQLFVPEYKYDKNIFPTLRSAKQFVRFEYAIKSTPRFKWVIETQKVEG